MSSVLEPSGKEWCARFPTSTSLDDLAEPFQSCVIAFIEALRDAGAAVEINGTYRPPERAYLMHWACMVAKANPDLASIPAMAGVPIDWACGGDRSAARAGAAEMVRCYDIAFPAALVSRHTQRRAVDMTIKFKGPILVRDARGQVHSVTEQSDLWPIGASYGVVKLPTDAPHWSDDGH